MGGMFAEAVGDLVEGMRLAPLWITLGWQQTIGRFRRTLLGPFWLSANLLFIALALTFLMGGLTGGNTRVVFATLITGLLSWSIIGTPMAESVSTYISSGPLMHSQRLPISFHAYLLMFRAMINFGAQLVALWAVFLLFRVGSFPAWPILITLPLVTINTFLMCLVISFPATRFRDVNQLIGFVIQIFFFITPVFWSPQQMSPRYRFLLTYNPFTHFVELIRQPMLGRLPSAIHYGWVVASMLVLSGLSITLLALYRKRVVFWL